jgi:hypothetical protein
MAHRKGAPKTPGSGRKKGSVNKHSAELKELVSKALNNKGGVEYLERLADDEPAAFCSLLRKNMVQSVEHDIQSNNVIRVIDFSGGKNAS